MSVETAQGRELLIFASAVSNIGRGPLIIEGRRAMIGQPMVVRQVVMRVDGKRSAARIRSRLRYVRSSDHQHWHLLRFDRYELRRAGDYSLVAPDRKTGFCLGDRQRLDPAPPGTPRFGNFRTRCGLGQPTLLSIREGITVGYLDDYRPALEGQHFDVTDLEPGRYVLVHHVNPEGDLRESNHDNNAASVLLQLQRGSVEVLATCPETATCDG